MFLVFGSHLVVLLDNAISYKHSLDLRFKYDWHFPRLIEHTVNLN